MNLYASHYFEENIYILSKQQQQHYYLSVDYHVIFITNKSRSIPIWCQRSSVSPDTPVVWDYHVVLLAKHVSSQGTSSLIYDYDSTLSNPIDAEEYLLTALRCDTQLHPQYNQ